MQLSYYLNISPIKSQFSGVAWSKDKTMEEKYLLRNYLHLLPTAGEGSCSYVIYILVYFLNILSL